MRWASSSSYAMGEAWRRVPTAGPPPAAASGLRRRDVLLGGQLGLADDADRAGHPVRPMVAVAARVLVQVALVVVLGEVERTGVLRRPDLRGDLAEPVVGEHLLEGVARRNRSPLLVRGGPVDRR